MGESKVIIHSESQLVSWQIEGTNEVKNDQLQKYAKGYEKAKADFQEVILRRVPRDKIRRLMNWLG